MGIYHLQYWVEIFHGLAWKQVSIWYNASPFPAPPSTNDTCPLLLRLENNFPQVELNWELMVRSSYFYKENPNTRGHYFQEFLYTMMCNYTWVLRKTAFIIDCFKKYLFCLVSNYVFDFGKKYIFSIFFYQNFRSIKNVNDLV